MKQPFFGERPPSPRHPSASSKTSPSKNPKTKNHKKPKKKSSFFGALFKTCVTVMLWCMCAGALGILWFSYDLPSISELQYSNRRPSVVIQTQSGEVIGNYGDLHEETVRIKDLPPYVYQAVLAIEDRRFYYHFGLDFVGLLRAAYTNYQANRVVQGGSTITQQLGKNFLQAQGLYGPTDRSLRRKVQEAIMALWLEWHFTKEQILTIYLNRVYLGARAYGIDAAARKYFGCSARELNVPQSAVIAGLLKAPSRYSPLAHPERSFERTSLVLTQMEEEGYITDAQKHIQDAKHTLIERLPDNASANHTQYFTDWIYQQIPNYVPLNQDLIVTTTLDPILQARAHQVCLENRQKGLDFKASQVALLSMRPDGAVKAMVGGYDYKESQFNRALALRQSGSIFKAFVYLAGLEAGLSPDTLISDMPVHIGSWSPSSFKWKARGEITMTEGFAHSVNPVTVRVGQYAGVKRMIHAARRLGLTGAIPPHISMTLGSTDATLLQLTSAFSTFAHNGFAVWPYAISEIKNRKGDVLYKYTPPHPTRVIEPRHLAPMRHMLNAVVTWGSGRASKFAQGGKSGSNDDFDAWFIGYTDKLVTGVWIGNDNRERMVKKSVGGRLPTWIWRDFHDNLALDDIERENMPENVDAFVDHVIAEQDTHGTGSALDEDDFDRDNVTSEITRIFDEGGTIYDLPAQEMPEGGVPQGSVSG